MIGTLLGSQLADGHRRVAQDSIASVRGGDELVERDCQTLDVRFRGGERPQWAPPGGHGGQAVVDGRQSPVEPAPQEPGGDDRQDDRDEQCPEQDRR